MGREPGECRCSRARAANQLSWRGRDGASGPAAVEEVGSRSDRERLERSRVDYEAWRCDVEVCSCFLAPFPLNDYAFLPTLFQRPPDGGRAIHRCRSILDL